MSDTPQTDKAAYDYVTGLPNLDGVVSAYVARKLERSNNALLDDTQHYIEKLVKFERENAALRELIVKEGYIVTYFNDTIGLACDPYYKPEQKLP